MRKANGLFEYRSSGEYIFMIEAGLRENNLKPHQYARSKRDGVSHNHGLLICDRVNADWAISVEAVKTLHKAETDGKIKKGYVMLEHESKVETYYTASEVLKEMYGKVPNPGKRGYGDYYFFDKGLTIVRRGLGESNM